MKYASIRNILILLLFNFLGFSALAQHQMGTVWASDEYTNKNGDLDRVTKQDDGTYIACGWVNHNGDSIGYMVHFEENGRVLGDYMVYPPNDAPSWSTTGPLPGRLGAIHSAYITADGNILTLGRVINPNSPNLGVNINGAQPNVFVQDGTWISKLKLTDKGVVTNDKMLVNRLDRGVGYVTGTIRHNANSIILVGFDYVAGQLDKSFLFRTYDENGVLTYDNYGVGGHGYNDLVWVSGIERLPNGNYAVSSFVNNIQEYDKNTFARVGVLFTPLAWGESCVKQPIIIPSTTPSPVGPAATIAIKQDGGFFATGRMGSYSPSDLPLTGVLGWVFYEKDKFGNVQECKITSDVSNPVVPSDVVKNYYDPPKLLPGSGNQYVGTVGTSGVSRMYLLTDNNTGFDLDPLPQNAHLGEPFPLGTRLVETSHTDGFFAVGNNAGVPSIAKLSTCVNFKIDGINRQNQYFLFSNSVRLNKTMPIVGNMGAISYKYYAVVKGGTVDGFNVGDTIMSKSVSDFTSLVGTDLTLDHTYSVATNAEKHAEVEYTVMIQDTYSTGVIQQFCLQSYSISVLISSPTSTLFNDDVWYFSNNKGVPWNNGAVEGTPFTSKAIIFKTDANGNKIPTVPDKTSLVNSWENSLSVSTPACEGGVIFYAQHNQVFTTHHEKMQGGDFKGVYTTADGLAAAYIGGNKYMLFSVSDVGAVNNPELNYYIIDMAGDNGKGSMTYGGKVGTETNIGQGIELIPKTNTSDQYWLIYTTLDERVKVYSVDGATQTMAEVWNKELPGPVGYNSFVYKIASSKTFDKFAMSCQAFKGTDYLGKIFLYDFNPATGEPSLKKDLGSDKGVFYNIYGVEFSPNGEFVYYSHHSVFPSTNPAANEIIQYNTLTETIKKSEYTPSSEAYRGGGIKLGPDNKIYITREGSSIIPIIHNPDEEFSASNKVDIAGLELINSEGVKFDGYGLSFSTGLTPPWKDPFNSNKSPVANPDNVITYAGMSAKVNPLANDFDEDGPFLDLKITRIDSLDGKIHFVRVGNDVTFNFQNSYAPEKDSLVYLFYTLKDVGTPIQQCDEGVIRFYIRKVGDITLMDSCSFAPKLRIDLVGNYNIVWEIANTATPNPSNSAHWDVVAGNNTNSLKLKHPKGDYIYRYKVKSSEGESYYSPMLKIGIDTHKVANNIWYSVTKK